MSACPSVNQGIKQTRKDENKKENWHIQCTIPIVSLLLGENLCLLEFLMIEKYINWTGDKIAKGNFVVVMTNNQYPNNGHP